MADSVLIEEAKPYLLGQAREAYGRVVYSHKTHEKQADICFKRHQWQQWALVVLTTLSSGTFLAAVLDLAGSPQLAGLVTSSIALLVTGTSLGMKTFKFSDDADRHRDIAARLWDVRESYLSLIADLMSNTISLTVAGARRDQLQKDASAVYTDAPRTTPKAYSKASNGLKNNEELTFTSREIDLLLPQALRLNESEA